MAENRTPTDAELEILQILWQRGPATVRQIQHALNEERSIAYTTPLKLLQIMTTKGLVERDETVRPQVYRAAFTREGTQRQLLRKLLDKAFSGSAKQLVIQLLSTRRASPADIKEMERLLDRIEGGKP